MTIQYGQLESLITPQLLERLDGKEFCVAGFSRSGKNILTDLICHKLDREYILTDSYQHLPWIEQSHAVIADLKPGVVVEGVRVPYILRKGLQEGIYRPDICIWCEIDWDSLEYCYQGAKNLDKIYSFNCGVQSVFEGWQMMNPPTEVITLETSFEVPNDP